MLLVTTALGIIGRELVRLLAAQGKPVRALVPRAKGELELKNYLAEEDVSSETLEVVVGGLHDPASIEAALQGVDGAALIVPASPDMVGLQSRFIRLAEEAGVSQISLLGMHGPVANDASVLLSLLGETERDLQASRLDWTIVRTPAFLFMQNVRTQAETVQKTGRLPLPLGNGSYHLIDARDIARVLAETMTDPTHRGQYYNLTGPEALTGEILAQQLSDVAGYRVLYFPLPPVVARAHMLKQHMPSWLVDDMLTMYREADAPQVNTLIADLTGSPARTFADYLEDERWAFERGEDEGQLKGWVETSALYMRT